MMGLAGFFCKEPGSIPAAGDTYGLGYNQSSTAPAQKHQGQNVKEHMWLGANKTLFVDTEKGISCNF